MQLRKKNILRANRCNCAHSILRRPIQTCTSLTPPPRRPTHPVHSGPLHSAGIYVCQLNVFPCFRCFTYNWKLQVLRHSGENVTSHVAAEGKRECAHPAKRTADRPPGCANQNHQCVQFPPQVLCLISRQILWIFICWFKDGRDRFWERKENECNDDYRMTMMMVTLSLMIIKRWHFLTTFTFKYIHNGLQTAWGDFFPQGFRSSKFA